MRNSGNAHSWLEGGQSGTATLEDSVAISYNTKHARTVQSSSHTPWYLPQGTENLYPHRNLHGNVSSSFIHNRPNLEATKMSLVGEWINILRSILIMEYCPALKSKHSSPEKTWEMLKCRLLSEESQSEKATSHDSNHREFWKRQNCGESKKTNSCQTVGEGRDE